ncbi:MAG TPA: hypothetical protein VLI67_01900 [Vicinamibacteria bacterium]|nr:hypothetical protein [Vicinamibacteria bacterium]
MTGLPAGPRVLDDLALAVDPDEALRFQGYQPDTPRPAEVLALLEEALALGARLARPRAVVTWLPAGARAADTLEVAGEPVTIPGVAAAWGEVEAVAAAVCSIGGAVEARVAALWEARELPLALMLDSVASGTVESLAEHVNDLLCHEGLAAGLRVTNRLSPGYGRWPVEAQRWLFARCPGDPIDVRLTDACLMTPLKSISLIVGAGVSARVDHYFSQCARCWMPACAYRRTPPRRKLVGRPP